jgi:hypothetical protein
MGNSLSGGFTRLKPFGLVKIPRRFNTNTLFSQTTTPSLTREVRHAR